MTAPEAHRVQFPMGFFFVGSVVIIVAVLGVWQALHTLYLQDATPATIDLFYTVRAPLIGLSVMLLAVVLTRGRMVEVERRLNLAEESEAKFRALIETAPDAVLIADPFGLIVLANQQAGKMFGYTSSELIGLPMAALLPDEAPGREAQARRRDGSTFPAEVRAAPMEQRGERLTTRMIRDLTERKAAEEERFHAVERLREIERLKQMDAFKTQFINMAAHELGTPLTPVRLQVDLLKMDVTGPLTAQQRRALAILDRNVERLRALLEDVLQVARLQAGRLAVDKQDADLARLLLEAVETFQEPARRAGVHIETRLAPGLHAYVDAKRITQVLFNLISNAIKFTPPGGSIVVEAEGSEEGVVFRVRDTGDGMKPEDISRLFQPFTQVHDRAQRTQPGTGLGLYISKGIVDLHGGHIKAESEGLGKGATFTVALPRGAPQEPTPELVPKDAVSQRARELV